jgi:hypothetical protein
MKREQQLKSAAGRTFIRELVSAKYPSWSIQKNKLVIEKRDQKVVGEY